MKLLGFVKGVKDSSVFKEKTCLLPFSVGQSYHEGDKLEASVSFAFKNFTPNNCFGVVCDTLQAETLAIGLQSYSEALEISIQKGDTFLSKNAATLDTIGQQNPSWLTRWSQWTHPQHLEYSTYRMKIDELCDTDSSFANAVDRTARKFLRGIATNFSSGLPPDAFDRCCNYVKNECAVAFLWAKYLKPNYIIYPMEINEAMLYVIQLIQKDNPDIMHPLHIRFVAQSKDKAKSTKPIVKDSTPREISCPMPIPSSQPTLFSRPPSPSMNDIETSCLEIEATLKQMKAELLSIKAQYRHALTNSDIITAKALEQELEKRKERLKDLNIYFSDSDSSPGSSPEHSPREEKTKP